ncbi:hypothetical protein [Maricaulis maris]|uniref:hypothetical protein n=1 Tax=Maricaulis maris TaxID=74318 RepID=UPI003B8B147C
MCAVNWGLLADVLGAIAGLITAAVAAWALLKSYPGWLRRQNHLRKSERAEQILASFYECRRSISSVRRPLITGAELAAAEEKLKDEKVPLENGKDQLVTAQAMLTRMHEDRSVWQKLNDLMPFASVNFGDEVDGALKATMKTRAEFIASAKSYSDAQGEFREGVRRRLFGIPQEGQEDQLEVCLKEQEIILFQHLRKYIET